MIQAKQELVDAGLHVCSITPQNSDPPSLHSVPVQESSKVMTGGVEDGESDGGTMNAENAELEETGSVVPSHWMQGKAALWKQSWFWVSQKKSPPSSHSVPRHRPPTRAEVEEVDDTEEESLEDVELFAAVMTDDAEDLSAMLSSDDVLEEVTRVTDTTSRKFIAPGSPSIPAKPRTVLVVLAVTRTV